MKRAMDSDEERITKYVDGLPTVVVGVHAGHALVPDASAKTLRAVCRAYQIDNTECTERDDYVKAVRDMPPRMLRIACHHAGVDATGVLERQALLDALRDAASACDDDGLFRTRECAICMEPYEPSERDSVLLCDHEMHKACLLTAAQTQFAATGNMPSCPTCRDPIKWTPGMASRRDAQRQRLSKEG